VSGYVEVFWSFHAPVYGTILPQSGRKFTYAVVLKSGATSVGNLGSQKPVSICGELSLAG